MPTHCTEAATCSGIRNSWSGRTNAGKPDSPDRTSGRPPAQLRPSRLPKSPRTECAIRASFGIHSKISCTPRLLAQTFVVAAVDDEPRRAADDRISRSVIFCSRITDRLPMFGIGGKCQGGLPCVPRKAREPGRYCQRTMAEPEGFEPSIGLYNPITV